eukprot:1185759-Prorocentrum_minimum.AAC.3
MRTVNSPPTRVSSPSTCGPPIRPGYQTPLGTPHGGLQLFPLIGWLLGGDIPEHHSLYGITGDRSLNPASP